MKINNRINYIENLYEKAYLCKASMDKCYTYVAGDPFAEATSVHYKNFLQIKKENPTSAAIAIREVIKAHPIKYQESYEYNKSFFEKNPEVDILVKECEQIENNNYSRTKNLRAKIINNDRINLNSVTPKMSTWEKICFKFKK